MVICTLRQRLNVFRPRLLQSPPRHPEASQPVDTQRPTWSFAPFIEDSMSFDHHYFSLPFVIQRKSSPMTHRDQHGCLHPSSKTQCLSTETTEVSPRHPEASEPIDTQRPTWSSAPFVEDSMSIDRDYFSLSISSSIDNQVRRHVETNVVIRSFCQRLNVYRPRLLKSPLLLSRDNQV